MVRDEGMAVHDFPMGVSYFHSTPDLKHACEKYEEQWATSIKHDALNVLTIHKDTLQALAQELVQVRELDGQEFAQWLQQHGLSKQAPWPPIIMDAPPIQPTPELTIAARQVPNPSNAKASPPPKAQDNIPAS